MMYVFIFGIIGMIVGYIVIVSMKLRSFGIGNFNSDRRRKATHSTLKRIILTHLQTLALVFGLSVPWPELMLNAISIVTSVTTFSENAKGIECLIEGQKDHAALYYGLLLGMAILPLAMASVLSIYWFVVAPLAATRSRLVPFKNTNTTTASIQTLRQNPKRQSTLRCLFLNITTPSPPTARANNDWP